MSIIISEGPGVVSVGNFSSIGKDVKAIFSGKGSITIGEYVTIGNGVKFIVESGDVFIDDWTTLHNDITVLSKSGVTIGEHCWFGQYTVIDGTGGLTIESGVRVGMYSQIWTHVAAGEQIEGCTLYAETPSRIGADVWLVGTCFVASGVNIGNRTVALAGSNITKDCPPNSVLAGAPARVREGLSFYREISLDEKFDLLREWLSEFVMHVGLSSEHLAIDNEKISLSWNDEGRVIFHKNTISFEKSLKIDAIGETHCCIESKRYKKAYTSAERRVLKYLSGNKARFNKL